MENSFIINELGEERNMYFNAVAPPIMQTSNFAFSKVDDLRKAFEDEQSESLYTRGINPTVQILSQKLAALDGAEACLLLNSGASAIFAAVFSVVQSGDHIISVNKPYNWAQQMFNNVLPRFGVSTTFVDGRSVDNFRAAITSSTRLIYLESPNTLTYDLQDLEAVAALARQHGIVTICDNSYCTPLYQQPIKWGIDLSLQSATKFIGGHSDVVAGVLSGTNERISKIFHSEFLNMGLQLSPFNAWLLLRGLRTLPVRLEKISYTTKQMVAWLKQHPKVESVLFPLDEENPQYALAKKQMSGACGLVTIIMKAESMDEIVRFCESLQHILMAVSWGGHESLALPKCASLLPEQFDPQNPEHRMIRFYFGLEEPEYLMNDIVQAFEK